MLPPRLAHPRSSIACLSFLLALVITLYGCGSGGGGGSATSGGNATLTQREVTLTAIANKYNALPHQDTDADNQAMLQFLQSRPEFEAAGSAMAGSVWARYRDGEIFLFVNDAMAEAEDVTAAKSAFHGVSLSSPPASAQTSVSQQVSRARSAADAIQLPAASNVLLFDNIGVSGAIPVAANFANPFIRLIVDNANNQLRDQTTPQKYNVLSQNGTPMNLKTVKNADVLYIYCHGGPGVDRFNKPIFVINTSLSVIDADFIGPIPVPSVANIQNATQLQKDIKTGDVGMMMLVERVAGAQLPAGGILVPKPYYYITPSFVAHNMTFNANSLVIINGCAANSSIGADFRSAFTTKGASAFGSWDGEVNAIDAVETGEQLISGLLGTPTQRPFAWPAILAAMQKNNHAGKSYPLTLSYDAVNTPLTHTPPDPALPPGKTKGGYTQFAIVPNGDLFGLLDPTLAFVSVDESKGQLNLIGDFGDDPGAANRSVMVQGTALNVTSWDSSGVITCDLPVSGPGAAGAVVVTVNGHASNPVMLTEWHGTLHADIAGQGGLLLGEDFGLHFRADVQSIRLTPGEMPMAASALQGGFAPAADSTNSYQASGEFDQTSSDGGVFTTTWAGRGQVPLYKQKVTGNDLVFNYFGNVDVASNTINFGLVSTVVSAYTVTNTTPTGETTTILRGAVLDAGTLGVPGAGGTSNFLTFQLDSNFNVLSGSQMFGNSHLGVTGGNVSATLSWKFAHTNFPPDPNTARNVSTRQRNRGTR